MRERLKLELEREQILTAIAKKLAVKCVKQYDIDAIKSNCPAFKDICERARRSVKKE